MVIIRVNYNIHPEALAKLRAQLRKQAETGAVIVPPFCEVLAEVPDGTEVEVVALQNSVSDCDDCGRKDCEYFRSAVRRINCPLWRAKG